MSRKLRVLQLITGLTVGGAETFLLQLCRALDRTRYKVVVAYLYDGALHADFEQAGVRVVNLGARWRNDPRAFVNLCRLLRQGQFDLLHTHLPRADWYGALAALLVTPHLPLLTSKHDDEPSRKRLLVRTIDRLASKRARYIVVISEWLQQFLVQHEGYSSENIICVPYGLPEIAAIGSYRREALRKSFLPQGRSFLVGTVGRLVPQKGHIHLLHAISHVIRVCPHVHFILIGDGELRLDLEKAATQLGVSSYVSFLGTRRDVYQIMEALDLFVLPSKWEAFGLVLLEAMRASRPIIASACGGVPEIVVNNQTGWLVPPGNSRALASKIIEVLETPSLLEKAGAAGRNRQQELYSLSSVVGRIDSLYSEVADEN